MIRAFTGPTKLTPRQQRWAGLRMLSCQPPADVWRSGCAYGVDTLAAWLALAVKADLELYIPFAAHNGSLVNRLAVEATHVIHCPRSPTNAGAYRNRNTKMVEGADHLLAFVWDDQFYRSGEWMTINIARKLGVPVDLAIIPESRS